MYRLSLALLLLLTSCKENNSNTGTAASSTQSTGEQSNANNNETTDATAPSQPSATNESNTTTMEQPTQSSRMDARIIGTWKNTEVISSGSNDSYGSFSSETFIEFTADGVFSTWQGQSAGSGGGQSFESNGSSQKQSLRYRTEGKMIVFIDPSNGQEAKTQYMVDEGRMLLSDGGSNKKIYLKVE